MLFIGHWQATVQHKNDNNGFPTYSLKIVFKNTTAKQYKDFKLAPLEVISLGATL